MGVQLIDKVSLEEFAYRTDGFHDAAVVEITMKSNRYVSSDGWLHDDHAPYNMILVIQSQFEESHTITLHLDNVTEFRFDPGFDLEFEGEIEKDGIAIYLSGKANAARSVIRATSAVYEIESRQQAHSA